MASGIQLVPGWGPGALFSLCPGCRRTGTASRASNLRHSASRKLNGESHNLFARGGGAVQNAGRRIPAAGRVIRFSQPLDVRAGFVPGSPPLGLSENRIDGQSVEVRLRFGSSTQRARRGRAAAIAFLKPGSSSNHPENQLGAASELEQGELPESTGPGLQHDQSSSFHDQRPSSFQKAGDTSVRVSRDGRGRAKPVVQAPPQNRVWRRGGVPTPPVQTLTGTPLEPKPLSRTCVVVSNLPPETAQAEVESLFDAFGPLQSVELSKAGKGKLGAVVRYLEPWATESAAKAVLKGNGFIWQNHRLRVSFEGAHGGGVAENGAGVAGSAGRESSKDVVSNDSGVSDTSGLWKRSEVANGTGALNGSRVSDHNESSDQCTTSERSPVAMSKEESDALGALEGAVRKRLRDAAMHRPPDVRKVEHLFAQLLEPTEPDYASLLRAYAQAAEKHKARATFEHMCDKGIRPSRLSYHNLLQAYCNSGAIQSATSLLAEMEANGVPPDGVTYSFLVLYYARAKNRRQVLEVFDTIRKLGLSVPPNVYSAAINAHIQTKQMRAATALFKSMEGEGMRIPLGAYNAILDGYASAGDEAGALHVFRKVKAAGLEPSVITFGGLIKLYTRKAAMASAARVVAEMRARGIAHSKQTHSMLISGHAAAGDVEAAYAAFQDMARSKNRPDVIAYTAIITCFARAGQMDRAYDMLRAMEREGQRPNTYTYTSLIDGWARQGDLPKAMEAIRAMRASGTLPTVATFTCVVSALAKTGQMTKAVRVIDEMRKLNVAPDTGLYVALISGYANIGDVLNAFEVFNRVKAEGLPMDKRLYSTLLNACAKVGRMQSAVAVVGEMRARGIEADVITYNTLLDGWAKRGDVWEAADVIEQMQAAGVAPDTTSFCLLIYACMKASDMNKALTVLDEMERLGLKPTLEIYSVLIEGWCQAGQPERALSVFAHLKREGLTPDYPAYHCLMSGLLSSGEVSHVVDDVIALAAEMRDRGYEADQSTARFWKTQLRTCERQLSGPNFASLAAAVGDLFPSSSKTATERDLQLDLLEEADVSQVGDRNGRAVRPGNPEGVQTVEVGRGQRVEREMGGFGGLESARASGSFGSNRLEDFERVGRVSVSRGDTGYRRGPANVQPTRRKGAESAGFEDSGRFRRAEDEPRKGAWRHAKQRRMLEASKELEAEYSKSRREEMLTFLTHTERESLGAGYERIDPATRIPRDRADGDGDSL